MTSAGVERNDVMSFGEPFTLCFGSARVSIGIIDVTWPNKFA